jgi:predicted aldo/keto reductase-like oxidoreductase
MFRHNRREFLRTSLVGTGLLMASPRWVFSAEAKKAAQAKSASDRVPLGKTGIQASLLAQGTGYSGNARSSAQTRMGKPAFDALLRHSLDQGINFIDMADLYGSHPFVKDVVKGLPREKYVLLTKIWTRRADWVTPSGGAKEELDRFRKELDVEMIDICLLHCMTNSNWVEDRKRVCDELADLKQKGVVRAVGVSCHDHGALKTAATHPWVDVIFARINHKGRQYDMDDTVEEITKTLKLARSNGKAVVGMKIFGAGKLVKPEEKDASLKYVLGNNLVDAMTIGMLSKEQVDDSITRINQTLKTLS